MQKKSKNHDELEIYCSLPDVEITLKNVSNITQVHKLEINVSDLEYLPETICDFKGLEIITTINTRLNKIPACFGTLQNLKEIHLNDNSFEQLPGSICNLSNLKELHLARNPFTQLPDNFGSLTALEKLDLWRVPLENLPDSFGNLINLKEISISIFSNKKLIPSVKTFESLKKLEAVCVDVSYRNMKPLFIALEKAGNVKNISLFGYYSKIPEEIGRLKNLIALVIESGIETLPKSIGELKNLEFLDLSRALLNTFPEELALCTSLKTLCVDMTCMQKGQKRVLRKLLPGGKWERFKHRVECYNR